MLCPKTLTNFKLTIARSLLKKLLSFLKNIFVFYTEVYFFVYYYLSGVYGKRDIKMNHSVILAIWKNFFFFFFAFR